MNHKHLIIWLLACFLITYHTVQLYSGLVDSDDSAAAILNWSSEYSVRVWIIFSLMLVIMFKRVGLISMWVSVITLVVMQYLTLSGEIVFIEYFSPLKGFILPLIITWLFRPDKTVQNSEA